MDIEKDLKIIKKVALEKDEFVFRLLGVVKNYSCCPIVFNVYEKLKDELWHYDEYSEDDFYE